MTPERAPARSPAEERVEECLRQSQSTRYFFSRFARPEDSRELVHLLCYAVLLRAQPGKIGPLMADSMGTTVDNLRNAPTRIKTFCEWLRPLIRVNYDMRRAPERYEAVFPILNEVADHIKASVDVGRIDIQQWDSGLTETLIALVRLVKRKTGTPSYNELSRLLAETAVALGLRQAYSAEFIRMRVRKHGGRREHRSKR